MGTGFIYFKVVQDCSVAHIQLHANKNICHRNCLTMLNTIIKLFLASPPHLKIVLLAPGINLLASVSQPSLATKVTSVVLCERERKHQLCKHEYFQSEGSKGMLLDFYEKV